MRIDLTPLVTGKTQEISFEYRMESDPGLIFDHLHPKESRPVLGSGKVSKSGRRFMLNLTYSGQAKVPCDRCLELYDYEYTGEISCVLEKVSAEHAIEEDEEHAEEVYRIEGDSVELDPIVGDDILLNLPLRMLCRETCAGLCQMCGQNLNTGSCACELDTVDPRMAALQELLKRKEV